MSHIYCNITAWFNAWRNSPDYAHGNGDAPVDTVITIDVSGSMNSSDISNAVTAAKSYIATMREGDRVAILSFSDYATVWHPLTSDKNKLYSSLNNINAYGGTYYNAAIRATIEAFDATIGGIKVAVFMSDGNPSDLISQSTLKLIENSGVILHSVCYGSMISALEKLSKAGRGETYYATEIDQLLEAFTKIGLKPIVDGPDSDNDGLSDKLEVDGMICSNGMVVHTDPYNDDTDGDGLKDGAKILYHRNKFKNGKTTYVFTMKTCPYGSDVDDTGFSDFDRGKHINKYGKNSLVHWFTEIYYFDPSPGVDAYAYPNKISEKVFTFEENVNHNCHYNVCALVYANGGYWLKFGNLGDYFIYGYVSCDDVGFDMSDVYDIIVKYYADPNYTYFADTPNYDYTKTAWEYDCWHGKSNTIPHTAIMNSKRIYTDSNGIRRFEFENGIRNDLLDYYCVALGHGFEEYGQEYIGNKSGT